jgi:hypothetical protein
MLFTLDIKTSSFSSPQRGGTLARMSEEPENWRRRVYRPGYEISDELAAMLDERMADDDAFPESLFPDDPKVQRTQRNGYTRDENILREWHREVFGESLWIDSELHEAIRKRAIEFRRNPDEATVPWDQVRTRLQRRASALRLGQNRDL